jgi:thiol-disulfide isomerase/thioredoxin
MKKIVVVIVVLCLALALGIGVYVSSLNTPEIEPIVTEYNNVGNATAAQNKHYPNLNSFTAYTLDGGTFTAENFKGYDITVMNIWGTYCGPCREEMPQIGAFSNSLPKNIQFITFCIDASEKKTDAKSILSSAGFSGTTIITGNDDLVKLYNKIQYVPTTLFFDSQGNCIGEEIIGSQSNVSGVYTSKINSILTEMGKDTI